MKQPNTGSRVYSFVEIIKDNVEQLKLLEQIKRDYPTYGRVWGDDLIIPAFKNLVKNEFLNEFDSTVNPVLTQKTFEKDYPNQVEFKFGVGVSKLHQGDIDFIWVNYKSFDDFQKINSRLDAFGWYGASFKDHKKFDTGSLLAMSPPVDVKYEAKYDVEIDLSGTKYIYHLTPDLYWTRVSRLGLTPKMDGKLSPTKERVYFIIDNNDDRVKDLAQQLFSKLTRKYMSENSRQYFILRIDVEGLQKSAIENRNKGTIGYNNIGKFFKDPNMPEDAVWTPGNVPPKYIEHTGTIDTNPEIPDDFIIHEVKLK
jgi:hypothetical protein